MINLGKLILPTFLILKFEKDKLTLRLPEYMTKEYYDDSECFLHFNFINTTVFIDYYCEDDFYLSVKFDIDSFASGDLKD